MQLICNIQCYTSPPPIIKMKPRVLKLDIYVLTIHELLLSNNSSIHLC